ncbi:MAG TPA: DUF4249 domain-containing protein [Mucilaginibacter sp.]|jgi:hypothetical protein|nr:DUF4249 domain-containing protein [Mucilaginibacter sp.]
MKWIYALFVFLIADSCKKPFIPQAISSDNNRYLVIEGVVNSGNDSTFIKLSRTQKIDTTHTVSPEINANVTIESNAGANYKLAEITAGTYAAPPLNLDATRKYRLHIKTSGNKEYISDYVVVKNSPPIDSVGFVAASTGVQVYVNTHDATNSTRYYRWDYAEDWQFHAKYPSTYYSNGVDSLKARTVSQQVYDCFAHDESSSVTLTSTTKLTQDNVYQAPITTIPSTSEKIETKYSILVKQFALTSDAYSFWLNLQTNTEKLGSIFDVLPSENRSNFHCVTVPGELVVGYFSVGSIATKRIFITAAQLLKSYSPVYPAGCQIDTVFDNPPHPHTLPFSVLIPPNSPYVVLLGLYLPPANPFGKPTAYSYTTRICGDCTIRGSTKQPAFWK